MYIKNDFCMCLHVLLTHCYYSYICHDKNCSMGIFFATGHVAFSILYSSPKKTHCIKKQLEYSPTKISV